MNNLYPRALFTGEKIITNINRELLTAHTSWDERISISPVLSVLA